MKTKPDVKDADNSKAEPGKENLPAINAKLTTEKNDLLKIESNRDVKQNHSSNNNNIQAEETAKIEKIKSKFNEGLVDPDSLPASTIIKETV